MLLWLQQNIGTVIVCIVMLIVISLLLIKAIRDKKKGKSFCGCGCKNCAMHDKCNKK